MDKKQLKRLLILNIPYFIIGLLATNIGEAWRMAEGADLSAKLLGFFAAISPAFSNPMPSFHPADLLVGILGGCIMRLAVYLKGKNAKKYRHNVEYGSARWGTPKDIEPFADPKFENNVILTRTEHLMMSNRPKNPANARNKNVLIIGGSGSGKTRFWLKPNLLQMHSSYVVTDPKGSIVIECGNALLKGGYNIKIFNTINFKKSMHYKLNPSDEKMKAMMLFIHAHYHESISVEDIAKEAHISKRACFRLFQEHLHMTPVEYMTSYRLRKACQRLADTNEPITQIAYNCGLGSSSYFGKMFRERYGCTPAAYRKEWHDCDKNKHE